MRKTRMFVGTFLGFAALCLCAAPLMAMDYAPLSVNHTDYNISQYQVGNASGNGCKPKLRNPTSTPMAVAVILYERNSGGDSDNAGIYSHCQVAEVGPHAIVTVDGLCPGITEAIAAPVDPVMVDGAMTRVADGLGVQVHLGGYGGGPLSLMYPPLFSGPADPADKKAAAKCINQGLTLLGLSPMIFSDFVDLF